MRFVAVSVVGAGLLLAGEAPAFVWPSTIERVDAGLGAEDPGARKRAAKELLLLPRASVRRMATPLLSDPDPDVRIAALEALLAARAEGLGERVASWLGDGDPRVRRAATEALVRYPVSSAVPALGRILSDPDAAVRLLAARALGASGAPSAVVPLLGRLDDSDAEVREAAASALSRIKDPSAVVPLIGKIQDGRPNVRRSVARALGALGDPRAASALILLLRDPDELVRVAALEALGRLRSADSALPIASLLSQEKRPSVREAALDALARIASDAGIAALIAALSDDDPRERSPVRAALVLAGSRAVPLLAQCLRGQPSQNVADGCALALAEASAEDAVPLVAEALRRGVVRPQIGLRAFAARKDPRALGTVLEYLGVEDPWVRRAAMEAADALLDPAHPDGRAVEPITHALDAARGRRAERLALVALLGKTGSPRAIPVLGPIADHSMDPGLRVMAVVALGQLGRSGQDAVLLRGLDAELPTTRLAAAMSLRRTAGEGALGPLLERFERAASQDREAVLLALSGALAVTRDAALLSRVEALLSASDGPGRDALVEAMAAPPGKAGSVPLSRLLAAGADPATRAKVAEVLAAHPEAAPTLRGLLADGDASVRANAAWSLGVSGGPTDVAALSRLLADRDVAVAGNAAAALGMLASRGARGATAPCAALADSRAYVRANTLGGLAFAGIRCQGGIEERLLATDPSEVVRAAAARILWRSVRDAGSAAARSALERCTEEEPSGEVATACAAPPRPESSGPPSGPVLVYVVPAGGSTPVPRAPFALVRSDGLTRLGLSDRRGAVYEASAPAGSLRLAIPAPLSD